MYRFPLYSRTTIPSNPVLFAISLLNQNIVQLFYQLTNSKVEFLKTLQNLHSLLSTTMDKYKYTRVKNDSTSSSHGEDQHLLHFHQSNDSALNLKVFTASSENGEYESLKKNSSSSMRWVFVDVSNIFLITHTLSTEYRGQLEAIRTVTSQ